MAGSNVTRIPVRHNPNYQANGTKSMVWLYHKYNITPHHSSRFHRDHKGVLMKRQADGSSTQVTSEDQQNDTFYTCPVLIGTPGQQLEINFDSGSADFWVWSTKLAAKTLQTAKGASVTVYDPSKSTSQKPVNQATWKIQYGDGSGASGTVVTDIVKIGDITIQNQGVEVATTMSDALARDPTSQGILGLAFGSINSVVPVRENTPLENMIAQQDIPGNQELFTCYLGSYKDVNAPDQGRSFYTFGTIDQEVVQATGGQIAYTPVDTSNGFWEFDSAFVSVNGQQVPLTGNAIADTGTTLMLVDDNTVQQIYSAIPGAMYSDEDAGWVFRADTPNDSLPVVTVAVGQTEVTIEKEQLGFAPANNPQYLYGGIQSRGESIPLNIYGDIFLKAIYAVFDAGNKQFGVVQRVDPSSTNKA